MDPETPTVNEPRTGLEDVVRSVRELARSARTLAERSGSVLERELAMAITLAERIRDDVVSPQMLEEARKEELPAQLRQDAHRAIDLAFDVGAVLYVSTIKFVEGFVDEPRPALAASPGGQ
jgi:hypothetical protein